MSGRLRLRLRLREPHARWRLALLTGSIALFGGVGIVHLVDPEILLPIMPGWVPRPRLVVLATGVCEVLGCAGLTVPALRPFAGAALALYGVCVFPANVKQALEHIPVSGLPDSWWYHAPRLACQPLLVWAPLFAAGLVDWPFRGERGVSRAPGGRSEGVG